MTSIKGSTSQIGATSATVGDVGALLLDLDGTIFDHYHSARSALAVCAVKFPILAGCQLNELITLNNLALERAYNRSLSGELAFPDIQRCKVKLLDEMVMAEGALLSDAERFTSVYEESYRLSRRFTPTCGAMLGRVLDAGLLCAVVTNGEYVIQQEKLESIGLGGLPLALITSDRVGHAKPNPAIFRAALDELHVHPREALMVGDSLQTDIEGAFGADVGAAILYNPMAESNTISIGTRTVPVIQRLASLLDVLGIPKRRFGLQVNNDREAPIVRGIGIDAVTIPDHCITLNTETIRALVGYAADALIRLMRRDQTALSAVAQMAYCIASASRTVNEDGIDFAGLNLTRAQLRADPQSQARSTQRGFSCSAEIPDIILPTNPDMRTLARLAEGLQASLDLAAQDAPKGAIRHLAGELAWLSHEFGYDQPVEVLGAGIEGL